MKQISCLLTICILLHACKKDTANNPLVWSCDNSQSLDSAATAARLAGSWRLVQQRLGWTFEIITPGKTVVTTFNADATFTVTENATVTAQGNWKLYRYSDSQWALDLTSPSPYLHGAISFCNNKVLFTNSPVDGDDNLFEKKD